MMYATTRIVGRMPGTTNVKTGTAFFYHFAMGEGQIFPVLITNKHVIEGTSSLEFLLWPAPGFEDTKLGVLMEPEVRHGTSKVYTRVQA